MSSPQPAAPSWFARLSPLRRLGAVFGTALVLSLVGAAGFIALLPADSGTASLIEPAAVAGTGSVPPGTTATAGTAATEPTRPGTDTAATDPTQAGTDAGTTATDPTQAATDAGTAATDPAQAGTDATAGTAATDRSRPGTGATAGTAGVGPAPTAGAAPKPTNGTDPRFGTCQQARQHGYGPYRRGDTGYGWYPDADDDGVVCE